jgi:hypothetical protein
VWISNITNAQKPTLVKLQAGDLHIALRNAYSSSVSGFDLATGHLQKYPGSRLGESIGYPDRGLSKSWLILKDTWIDWKQIADDS